MSTFERAGRAAYASLIGALREAVAAWEAYHGGGDVSSPSRSVAGAAAQVTLIEAIAKQVLAFGPLPADIRPVVWSALLGCVCTLRRAAVNLPVRVLRNSALALSPSLRSLVRLQRATV